MLGRITIALLIALIVWGNLVSGLGAGLACPDWPLCYGKYLPPLRWDIILEKGHRVLAAITGIVFLALCVVRFLKYKGYSRAVPIVAAILLAVQIPLGGIVVLLGLPVDVTTAHFSVAMLIFSLGLFLAFHDGVNIKPAFKAKGFAGFLFVFALLVLFQSVLGAYVRHSQSGLSCGMEFPKCLGFWIPPTLSGTVLTHFLHRAAAYLVLIAGLAAFGFASIKGEFAAIRVRLAAVLALIAIQIAIGVVVVYTQLHVMPAAYHVLIALLIFTIISFVLFREMGRSHV